jgi:hypothetical protein
MSKAIELAIQLLDLLESEGHNITNENGLQHIMIWKDGNQIEVERRGKTLAIGTI